jgi:hypothetical protein
VDRSTGLTAHVHVRRGRAADRRPRPGQHQPHVHGHLPGGQHPRRLRRLAVLRHAGRRDRKPHRPRQRARPDRLRQRHRTHRKPVARRRRRHPHLLLPRHEGRGRRGPGHGHVPDAAQGPAARHHAALHRPVQRCQRPHRADRRLQRHADRAADLRLLPELRHPAARHCAGRARPPATTTSSASTRSTPTSRAATWAARPPTCRRSWTP